MRKLIPFLALALLSSRLSAQTEPAIRSGERFDYVSMECKGSFAQIEEKLGLLMEELAKQKVEMAGGPMGVFHNAPGQVKEEDLLWELAAPTMGAAEVQAPLVKKEFAYAEQAEMTVKGPYGDTGQSIGMLMAFIMKSGYKPCGPVFETWMDDPSQTKPEDCRTLIVIPVEKQRP